MKIQFQVEKKLGNGNARNASGMEKKLEEKEVAEDEFMEYLDKKEEPVA